MDHQICVACSRKQRKGKRSCECGHVLKEDINVQDGKSGTGCSRLRAKRSNVCLDDMTTDLVLKNVLDQEKRLCPKSSYCTPQKPTITQTSKGCTLKSTRQRSLLYSFNTTIKNKMKIKTHKPRNNKLFNKSALNKHINRLTVPKDTEFLSFVNAEMNEILPKEQNIMRYPSALEDINQKLMKQNGICRMAYL